MYPRVASNQRYSPMPRMGQAQAIPPRPTGTPRGESPGFGDDMYRMPDGYRNGRMPPPSSNVYQGNLEGFGDDMYRRPGTGGGMPPPPSNDRMPVNVFKGNYWPPGTGGGMPPPPSNVYQGNPWGFGDDMYRRPGTGGGFPQPPGRVMDGPGSGYGMPRDPGDTIRRLRPGGPADTSWQPNPDEYQRSIAEERARAAKQDSDLAARRQKKQQQRPEYDVPGFDQPVLDSIVANNEYDRIDRETRASARGRTLNQANGALQQEIANNAAGQQGLGSLDGPITEDDERQTIGGPNGRMTVADMKRQRQRASQALRQQELKSQQERAAVDSVMQEFPGINPDIANAILQKRQQQSLADGRARANQELGINQTPAPQPISGGMGRPALPQVRMPQMPAPSFPIQRFGGSGTYY